MGDISVSAPHRLTVAHNIWTDDEDDQACEAAADEPRCDHRCVLYEHEDDVRHMYGYVMPSDADTIDALVAERAELRAALAPFAAGGAPPSDLGIDGWPARWQREPTVGDVRRAAALLGDEEEGTDG